MGDRMPTACVRALTFALIAMLVTVSPGSARAADGPPAGRYEIRTYHSPSPDPSRHLYAVLTYMLLRGDGGYEVYDAKSNELRSRGTYAFEPGNGGAPGSAGLVRWKSGLNYEMGRGGSYFPRNQPWGCDHCIQMNRLVIAVLTR